MSTTATILLMAAVTYLPRLAGFALSGRRLPPFWLRFFHFVPISVFTALIVQALPGTRGESVPRLLAAAVAALVIRRSGSLGLGILVGMAGFWLLRLL